MRARMWLGVWIVVAAVVASACGGGGRPAGGPPEGAVGSAVSVTENEWTIGFGAEVKAGSVNFTIKNEGAIEHNFVIRDLDVRVEAIAPGTSKQVTVNLQAGTYTVVCDIPGHEEAGMKATLTVVP